MNWTDVPSINWFYEYVIELVAVGTKSKCVPMKLSPLCKTLYCSYFAYPNHRFNRLKPWFRAIPVFYVTDSVLVVYFLYCLGNLCIKLMSTGHFSPFLPPPPNVGNVLFMPFYCFLFANQRNLVEISQRSSAFTYTYIFLSLCKTSKVLSKPRLLCSFHSKYYFVKSHWITVENYNCLSRLRKYFKFTMEFRSN